VSPNYANEIQSPEGGMGMHEFLKNKGSMLRLAGILNGISDEWSPITDPHIPKQYTSSDFVSGKAACKEALQKELGLHTDPNTALLGFCGRLCYQKGIHLIMNIMGWLMTENVQVIFMGKGDKDYASQIQAAEHSYKGRVCGYVGFDPKVEHRMMAGCDFVLMPSQYEPCGLPQMYAQQYACLPIVRETGGLKDSVRGLWDIERDRTNATGFLFGDFTDGALKQRLWEAVNIFHNDKVLFKQMQHNAISCDYYWPKALDEYEKHIDYTLEDPPCRQ
jgi:starch synthase